MKSIYGKLFLGFIVSLLLSFSVAGYFGFQQQEENIREMVMDEYHRIQENIENDLLQRDFASLSAAVKLTDVELIVAQGTRIYHFSDNFDIRKASEMVQEINHPTHFKQILTMTNMYKNGREYIIVDEVDNLKVYYHFNMVQEQKIFENALMFALLGIFVVGSFVFLIIADIIVKPIKRLTKATNAVTTGNYDVQVNYYGKDEIATLSQSFNLMAKRLVKSEENRQKFISDVSHEFQTPLTSIQGFAKILTAEQVNDEQRTRYASIILEQAIRLSTLSKNMMQLTLLEGDDLTLDKKKYSLTNQLQRVIEMQQGVANERQIDIVTDFPKGDIQIVADEDRMEQVFINLINNAVKYTLEEGVVTVNVKRNLMDIEVAIEDTGIGMNQEALGHIFDRFYRADKSRSIRGNGLGLSIVKRIVDLHHFKISVESQVDVGSVFKISIPQEKGLRINKKNSE